MNKVRVQKIRLKDLLKPSSSSPTLSDQTSSSIPTTASTRKTSSRSSQGLCTISTAEVTKIIKVDAKDLAKGNIQEARAMLQADELSKDGQRLNKRHIDVSGLSPVKRRQEGMLRKRSLAMNQPAYAPLSNTLQAVLNDFGNSGFQFVPNSRQIPDVQALWSSTAVKHGRRRYLASVSHPSMVFFEHQWN